ncbi:pyridoxamine 5'-phosphate oxidase [Clostridium puniceum]|uniref:Pyridoxamine 5'-phosphate oxidase n=1 Tax=Clostridium puniceum TaxID=29367 RepID=A0A1S8TB57_9CLOT|nr:pyridoxamine 5'-phosphate oxidase family protein [Clostridium puniceum]OOM74841.1 pyridoxamine 5'-phosphate oxidase [Clostridium puniceum]
MNTKNEFKRIMETQTEVALATSINDIPNVRIVNFYYDEADNTLFFSTFGDNDKVKEFELNNNVAFTTIPLQGNAHIKAKGKIKRSSLTIYDIADCITKKIPDYKETINQAGQYLILFEIKFDTAIVTLDFENIDTIFLK